MIDSPTPFTGLIESLNLQAAVCGGMASPFSQSILAFAAGDLEDGGVTRALLAGWAETPTRALIADAVPLRLLGALHDLALEGSEAELAAAYPAAAWAAALAAIRSSPERLIRFMDREPQTNEVRRSACLLGGFLEIVAATGLPLRVFEIGASAGLNQLWDRYHYRLGEKASWGPADSRVCIPTDWRGQPPPLKAPAMVVERAACDREPVDLRDAIARQRLRACVWADQIDRLERLDAAVAMALGAGTEVDTEDAVRWTERRVAAREGAVTVLFHSVFWQYMPAESQTALSEAIERIGRAAAADRPFAWLRMEPVPSNMATMEVRLTLWPGGEDRLLATAHPHGAWVNWEGG